MSDRRQNEDSMCACGHVRRWHGQNAGWPAGSGACEHDEDCPCEQFERRQNVSPRFYSQDEAEEWRVRAEIAEHALGDLLGRLHRLSPDQRALVLNDKYREIQP